MNLQIQGENDPFHNLLPQPPPTGQGDVPCFASLIYAIPTDLNVSHNRALGH